MHEYSIVAALLDRVEREARAHGAERVQRLHLRIGELSGVEVELLRTAFETFSERGICDHATLDVQQVPARWQCPTCNLELRRGAILRCPWCDHPARLAAGDEIILDRIEMEVADV